MLSVIFVLFSIYLANADNTVKIEGTIASDEFSSITLLDAVTGDEYEKATIVDNKFSFEIKIGEEKIMALFLSRQKYILLDVKPGETVKINYDPDNFENNSVEGSIGTDYYIKTVIKLKKLEESKQIDFIDSLVKENTDKLINLMFLQALELSEYGKTYDYVLENMKSFSDNSLYKQVEDQVNSERLTLIGSIPPEIELEDPDGNIVKLSSLRGQYVLIDFWASWCRPCRMENPNVVKAYKKYHDKGFTIYSVSLDTSRDNWLKAIKSDGLSEWTHVSDLKGWNCIAAQKYGVHSIPANFLLDKDGKIIAKNLRGANLENKLKEIFD